MRREETRKIYVGNIQIGGQNKCVIQSMTNVKAKDITASIQQINELADNGCEIVRLAVLDEEDAKAIKEIKKGTSVPLVADIHFNYLLALIALDSGVDAIRINPGNIGDRSHTEAVVQKCKERNVPIRIGINSGSLEKELLEKYGKPCAEAMIESAKKHIEILESLDFYDICLSFKSSDPLLTIDTYKLASTTFPYPLHLGVTEAGGQLDSSIKSSAALGTLLYEGIGDTIRVSVSGPPKDELIIAKKLLKCFNLYQGVPDIIACPTCGRIQYNMLPIVKEIEEYVANLNSDITIAIMGCPVNGIQEASRADVGIAGGYDSGILFKKGKVIKTIPQNDLCSTLKAEIDAMVKEQG